MGIVVRQGTLNAVWIYAGMAIGYLNAGYLFPKFLGVPEYGMTRLILSWSGFVVLAMGSAFPAVLLRHLPRLEPRLHASLFTALAAYPLVVGGGLLGAVAALGWPRIAAAYDDGTGLFIRFGFLVLPYSVALIYMNLLAAYLRIDLRSVTATFWVEVGSRLPNTAVIAAYIAGWIDLTTFFYAFAAAPLVAVAGMGWHLRHRPLWRRRWWSDLPARRWREIAVFALYSTFTGVPSVFFRHVDLILVGKILSVAHAGIYGLAVLFSVLVEAPLRALGAIYHPLMSRHMAEHQWGEARLLFAQTLRAGFLVNAWPALVLLVNVPWVLALIKPAYATAYSVLWILVWVPLVRALYYPLIAVLAYSPHYRWLLAANMAGISLNVLLDLWMIPRWGLQGAAAASVISVSFLAGLMWRVGRRKISQVVSVPWYGWKWIAGVLLLYGGIGTAAQWWGTDDPRFIVLGNAVAVAYAGVLWRWIPELRQMAQRKLRK